MSKFKTGKEVKKKWKKIVVILSLRKPIKGSASNSQVRRSRKLSKL
jgi:hypothetical protein